MKTIARLFFIIQLLLTGAHDVVAQENLNDQQNWVDNDGSVNSLLKQLFPDSLGEYIAISSFRSGIDNRLIGCFKSYIDSSTHERVNVTLRKGEIRNADLTSLDSRIKTTESTINGIPIKETIDESGIYVRYDLQVNDVIITIMYLGTTKTEIGIDIIEGLKLSVTEKL